MFFRVAPACLFQIIFFILYNYPKFERYKNLSKSLLHDNNTADNSALAILLTFLLKTLKTVDSKNGKLNK